jgi:hypothetical protein
VLAALGPEKPQVIALSKNLRVRFLVAAKMRSHTEMMVPSGSHHDGIISGLVSLNGFGALLAHTVSASSEGDR